MAKNLYLIGTAHIDPDGQERLENLYEKLRPKIVTVELSKDRADLFDNPPDLEKLLDEYAEDEGLSLRPEQRAIYLKIGIKMSSIFGFEYRAAKSHSEKNPDCRMKFIDVSFLKHGKEDYFQGLRQISRLEDISEDTKEKIYKMLDKGDKGVEEYVELMRQGSVMFYNIFEMLFVLDSDKAEEIVRPLVEEYTECPEELSGAGARIYKQIHAPERDEHMARKIRKIYSSLPSGNMVVPVGVIHIPFLRKKLDDLNPVVSTLDSKKFFKEAAI